MGIIIGAKPESSFADPLGLLSDCHRRIEKFLHTLKVIVQQAQECTQIADRERVEENEGGGVHLRIEDALLTGEQRQALEIVLCGFCEASPLRSADAAQAEINRLGNKWLADGQLTRNEIADLSESIQILQTLYRQY